MFLSVQGADDATDLNISSLMDTWIVLKNLRRDDDPQRRVDIARSRGMAHSPDLRSLAITSGGVAISDRNASSVATSDRKAST